MKVLMNRLGKSRSDKRDYLLKSLPNGMKCLLIEDKEADKSSAAMNINVGSLLDPREYYGLAHFLEHMLFMGTAKYPSENDFSEFLNSNSGHSNAFTDLDSTNYFFDVSNESFVPAVDRFAQFFISPNFNPSAVEREMKAVESENKKNLQSDMWRFLQLLRSEGHPTSAFTRFSTGNLETLNKPDTRSALVDYHRQYYSSNLMALVMLSPKSLTEMDTLTDSLFGEVVSTGVTSDTLQQEYRQVYPYDSDNLGFFYKIIPVREKDELSFYWLFNESLNPLYEKKPLSYLSSLFGHEGENSLHHSLIKDDLITSLSCGYSTVANTFTQFYIHIDLTKQGLQEYRSVSSRVMQYINQVQQKEINQAFFSEMKSIQEMKFNFKSKEDPTSYVSDLAYHFTVYKPEDILTGPYLIKSYDPNAIRKYLDGLKLENLNVYLTSKTLSECNLTEQWYGTSFSKERFLNQEKFSYLKGESNLKMSHILDYPPTNKFIPNHFDLIEHKIKEVHPSKIREERQSTVWYKQDSTFLLPKAILLLQIYLNKSILPVTEYDTICSLWNCIIENELKTLTYMAAEANIHFRFVFNLEGIYLQVSGFNSSLKRVTYEILNKLKEIISRPEAIENLREKIRTQVDDHTKGYKNFYFSAPYSQAMTYLDVLLREPSSSPQRKLESLTTQEESELTRNCNTFISSFLKESQFEWLIQGNISPEESLEIAETSEKILRNRTIKEENVASVRVAKIPKCSNYYYTLPSQDPNNQNSSIVSFFQAGSVSEYDKCCLYIIESLLREKFFDELRTKQSLGYIVKFAHKEVRKVDGFICLVQSNVAPPEDIQDRITKFLIQNSLKDALEDDLFEMHRQSVITDLKMKDLKLIEEVARNFSEIKKRDFDFDRKNKQIEIIKSIRKEDVQNLFHQIFISSPRRLDIEVVAQNHIAENEKFETIDKSTTIKRFKVRSETEFKKSLDLYPDFFTAYKKNYTPKY